jgi:hypothetical protein
MARIRTIKPEFWQDEKLQPLDDTTRLLFLGLISLADDTGRLVYNPKLIEALLFDPDGPDRSRDVRESLATLSRIARVHVGLTASGQKVLQIANWTRHQKVDKPNYSAALPEIVTPQEVTPVRESFANHSRTPRDSFATHTYDLRPTTNDLRPSLAAAADAAPEEALALALVPPSPKPRKPPKEPKPPKWPNWPKEARDAAYQHWLANFGTIDYARFISAAGPALGGGLPNYDPATVWNAWQQCVGIASIASSQSRFLRDPAKIGAHIAEACRILTTEPSVGEQARRLQLLLHGKEIA